MCFDPRLRPLKMHNEETMNGAVSGSPMVDSAAMRHLPSPAATFLPELFHILSDRRITYCVMGNTRVLPEIPENDIDIVCAPGERPALIGAFEALVERYGGYVAQVLQHESTATYHVAYLPLPQNRSAYVKLDLCTDYLVAGRKLLSAEWILQDREKSAAGFYTAAPDREFTYYLLKKLGKAKADGAALEHLSALLLRDSGGCRAALARCWPPASADLIARALAAKDWSPIAAARPLLQRQVRTRLPRRNLALVLAEWSRLLSRLLRPTGFVISVLGPDGSGKSTVLAGLVPRLSALGRRTARFHLKPPIAGRESEGGVVVDPHGQRPRGPVMSILKLLYLVFAYNLGWLVSVWLPRLRSGLIFFDRYYHDILADPRRYRNGAPGWVVRTLGRLIPTPDLFLVIDVAPEAVRARKSEVSAQEGIRQFSAYRALCAELPNAHLIDGNVPAEAVIAQCESRVAQAMARRLSGRGFHVPR